MYSGAIICEPSARTEREAWAHPGIALQSLLFALAMGLAGGFLPAVRAARLSIVDALRAA